MSQGLFPGGGFNPNGKKKKKKHQQQLGAGGGNSSGAPLTKAAARNLMNKYRLEKDLNKVTAPKVDLSDQLTLGGFSPFSLDEMNLLPEVIRPRLGTWDARALEQMVEKLKTEIPGYQKHKKDLPPALESDIFNLFNLPSAQLKFVEADLNNGWRVNLMQQLSHYYMRALTENNGLNTYIVTQELCRMLLEKLNPPEDDPKNKDQSPEDILKNMAAGPGSQSGNSALDRGKQQALDAADKRIQEIKDAKDNGTLPEDDSAPDTGKQAGSGDSMKDITDVLELLEQMKKFKMNPKTISNFIKQALNLSKAYFADKYKEQETSIFEADEIEDLLSVEGLFPQLRAAHLEDVMTYERKYFSGFDVYLDMSGSMNSSTGGVRAIDLVRVCGAQLLKMGLARNVHGFEGSITQSSTKPLEVLKFKGGGGTNTENVIQEIVKRGVPALILTDMQDSISTHSDLVYFVGLLGAQIYGGVGNKYLSRGQMASFDGQDFKILKPKNT